MQKQVADALECSPVTFLRYESGEREPNISLLIQLADFFSVTIDYLVGMDTASDVTEMEMLSLLRAVNQRAMPARNGCILHQTCVLLHTACS